MLVQVSKAASLGSVPYFGSAHPKGSIHSGQESLRRSYGWQCVCQNHSLIPKTSSAGKRQELNYHLVGYSAPSFSRMVDSSRMIQTNKCCFPESELPCMMLRQSIFSSTLCSPVSLLAPHSLRIPSTVVSGDQQCIRSFG